MWKEVYSRLKNALVLEFPNKDKGEITAANAAALSTKLCRMANRTVYADDGKTINIHSRKLDALEDIIEAQCGKPILLAYCFKHDLDRITDRLRSMGICYVKINSQETINRWNQKHITVGLIHLASAGHVVNLQSGGSTLVWYSLTRSLELYLQTNARLWRQVKRAKL